MEALAFIDLDVSELGRDLGLVLKVLLAIAGTAMASLMAVGLIGLVASSDATPRMAKPNPPALSVRHAEVWEGETYGRIDLRG